MTKKGRVELARKFNISMATASKVLNFQRTTEQHCTIRNYAVNNLDGTVIDL